MDMHIIKINKGIRSSCKQMSTQPKQKFASSLPTKKRPPSWTVGSPAAEKAAQMAYFVSWRLYASTTWGTCWAVDYMIPKAFKKKQWTMDFADSQLQHFLDSPTEKIAQSLHGHVILDSLVVRSCLDQSLGWITKYPVSSLSWILTSWICFTAQVEWISRHKKLQSVPCVQKSW